METGMTWTYKIVAGSGKQEPVSYERVRWPMSSQTVVMATRSRFRRALHGNTHEFTLKMRVKASALRQGGLQFPMGAELEILQDEFGVFENSEKVFLASTNVGEFMGQLVMTHSPDGMGSPYSSGYGYSTESGYSNRLLLAGIEPGVRINEKGSVDTLAFLGVGMLPRNDHPLLHFERIVGPSERKGIMDFPSTTFDDEILDQSFTEETWYQEGRGLVQLVQKRGDDITMMWILTDFSQ